MYKAFYYPEGSRYIREGIHHEVEYQNVSDKTGVAIQFGLVAFDIWNEFLDRTGGVTIKTIAAGAADKGSWVANAYADFSFQTGVAYVSKVRFEDGAIWSADLTAVLFEMRKIEKDFDVNRLKQRDTPKP